MASTGRDDGVDVLVIGGGVAGVRCARELRRLGFDGRIRIVGDEPTPPYNRPPLSKELLREDLSADLVLAESERWYERRSVELDRGSRVTSLDVVARRAVLGDGRELRWERCLLATGAAPRPLAVPGGERAILLRTLPDAQRLRREAVAAGAGARAVIVGGGFIGLEVASSLAGLGLRPTVVELGDRLWSGSLGERLSSWAIDALAAWGIEIRLGEAVTAVAPDGVRVGDLALPADLVVAGIGVVPRDGIAERAGLEVDGGIVVDAGQRTSHPAVWAAGDVARRLGRRIEHWHAAREAGERAARSMLGETVGPAPEPWLFSEVAGRAVDVVGDPRDGWDEERWIVDGRALAYLVDGRVVQLASIDGAIPPERMRELVRDRAPEGTLATAVPTAP